MSAPIHIALAPEIVTEIFGIPITNTLLMAWVVVFVLGLVGFLVGRKVKLVPTRLQGLFEIALEYVLNFMEETLESKKFARIFFPLITTLFLFILMGNLLQFIPGVGSVGFFHGEGEHQEFAPLFRSLNTDFNVTLALAMISFIVIEISGVVVLGLLKYGKKFVNFSSPIGFFLGIMELISEVARLISFSFRLFGNIFAGEVLIAVVIAFLPYLAPVPLLLYEVFVGFIQAAIFALLTLFFIKLAIAEHAPEEAH
ncbi:F0F1 ATP synthase subunit A [bacterium]|nr:F0F1 ATP synthase subunit A [bacterium]